VKSEHNKEKTLRQEKHCGRKLDGTPTIGLEVGDTA
jgi:hypothetical protein